MRKQLIKSKRAQRLLKVDWIEKTKWIKNTNHIQELQQLAFNEEGD